jgi:hypothetical protein
MSTHDFKPESAPTARSSGLTRQDLTVLLRAVRFVRESLADPNGRQALERIEGKLRGLLPGSQAC